MKRILFFTLFVLCSLAAFGQQRTLITDRAVVRDSIQIGTKWIYLVSEDSTFSAADHRSVATTKAIKDYVDALTSGGSGVEDVFVSSDTLYIQTSDSTYSVLLPSPDSLTWATTSALADSVAGRPNGSGTTNFLAKWLSSTSLGNSLMSDDGARITAGGTAGFVFPGGPTANRSGAPLTGEGRWNTTTGAPEIYSGAAWLNISRAASNTSGYFPIFTGTSAQIQNSIMFQTGTDQIDFLNDSGTGAALAGRIKIEPTGAAGKGIAFYGPTNTNIGTTRVFAIQNGRVEFSGGVIDSRSRIEARNTNSATGGLSFGGSSTNYDFLVRAGGLSANPSAPIFSLSSPNAITFWAHRANTITGNTQVPVFAVCGDRSGISDTILVHTWAPLQVNHNEVAGNASLYVGDFTPHGLSYALNSRALFPSYFSRRIGIGVDATDTLHVEGTARVTGSSTLPAATITGRDSLGVFRDITVGSGLSFNTSTSTLSASSVEQQYAHMYVLGSFTDTIHTTARKINRNQIGSTAGTATSQFVVDTTSIRFAGDGATVEISATWNGAVGSFGDNVRLYITKNGTKIASTEVLAFFSGGTIPQTLSMHPAIVSASNGDIFEVRAESVVNNLTYTTYMLNLTAKKL